MTNNNGEYIQEGDGAQKTLFECKTAYGKQHRRKHDPALPATRAITAMFSDLHERLGHIENTLDEIVQAMSNDSPKQYYTTAEVARLLGKKPYTVREWCRLERVHVQKIESGRGVDNEWRISYEELVRIQNEGLLDSPYRRQRSS